MLVNHTHSTSASDEEDNASIIAQRNVSNSTTASFLSIHPAVFDKGQTIPRPTVNEHPSETNAPGFIDHHRIRPVQNFVTNPTPHTSVPHSGPSLANGAGASTMKPEALRASPEIDSPGKAAVGMASVASNLIQSPPVSQSLDLKTSPTAESSLLSPDLSPIGNNMPVWRDPEEDAVQTGEKKNTVSTICFGNGMTINADKQYVSPFGTDEYNEFHGIPAGDEEQLERKSAFNNKDKGPIVDWMVERFRNSMHDFSRVSHPEMYARTKLTKQVAPSAGMRAYASARTMPLLDTEEGFLPYYARIQGLDVRPQVASNRQTATQRSEAAPVSNAQPSAPPTNDQGAVPWAHRSIPIDHPYIKAIWDRPAPDDRRSVLRAPITNDANGITSGRGIIVPTDHDIAWPTPHQAEEYARAQLAQKQNQYRMQQQQQQQYEMYSAGLMAPGDWGRLSIRYTSKHGETVPTVTRNGPGEVANGASMRASGLSVPQFCKESRVQAVSDLVLTLGCLEVTDHTGAVAGG